MSQLFTTTSSMIEPLEHRRLLSAHAATPSSVAQSAPLVSVAAASASVVKIRGVLRGHAIDAAGNKVELTLTILTHTHTGRLTGTVKLHGSFLASDLEAGFTGHVRSDRHVSILMSGSNYSVTFSGRASITGGRLFGSFRSSGEGNNIDD